MHHGRRTVSQPLSRCRGRSHEDHQETASASTGWTRSEETRPGWVVGPYDALLVCRTRPPTYNGTRPQFLLRPRLTRRCVKNLDLHSTVFGATCLSIFLRNHRGPGTVGYTLALITVVTDQYEFHPHEVSAPRFHHPPKFVSQNLSLARARANPNL